MIDTTIIRAGAVMALMRAKGLSFERACDLAESCEDWIWEPETRREVREAMEIIFQPLDS